MCGIKIPQQDFVLKMQGEGLMCDGWGGGGRICGKLRDLQIPHLFRKNCLQVT